MVYGAVLEHGTNSSALHIQLVNREIYHEAVWTKALYTKSLCLSSHHNEPNDRSIKDLPRMPTLQRLRLQLSAASYFELIGIRPQRGAPFAELEDSKHVIPLTQLPEVRQLELAFIDTSHPDAQCPWGGVSASHSCQKVWIDWFLTLALKHLDGKGICVTLIGCIPDSVRAKWELILKDAQEGRAIDTAADRVAILRTKEEDLPLKCLCTVLCCPLGAH